MTLTSEKGNRMLQRVFFDGCWGGFCPSDNNSICPVVLPPPTVKKKLAGIQKLKMM